VREIDTTRLTWMTRGSTFFSPHLSDDTLRETTGLEGAEFGSSLPHLSITLPLLAGFDGLSSTLTSGVCSSSLFLIRSETMLDACSRMIDAEGVEVVLATASVLAVSGGEREKTFASTTTAGGAAELVRDLVRSRTSPAATMPGKATPPPPVPRACAGPSSCSTAGRGAELRRGPDALEPSMSARERGAGVEEGREDAFVEVAAGALEGTST
jgi:hypothetical protein